MEQNVLMERTDKNLIEAHCKGDPTAFTELVSRYGGIVLGYLTKMCGNRDHAEDVFQETFKRVHEKGHTFRGVHLRPWILTIATNVARNDFRKKNRLKFVSLDQVAINDDGKNEEAEMAGGGPLGEIELAERKDIVRRVLGELPEKQRATVVLAYYQQMSYREVADVMECSIGTVKTQMHRAIKMLAKKLPDFGGDLK